MTDETDSDPLGLACEHGMLARCCEVCELQSEVRRLTADLAWARLNEARYRYLRENGEEFIGEDRGMGPEWTYGAYLDVAVDAARQRIAKGWQETAEKFREERDRISASYDKLLHEHIRVQLDEAVARIEDMLEDDDGQAFKEAGKFLLRIKGRDHDEA